MADEVERVAAEISVNARQVVMSLTGEFAPAPQTQSRQLTAYVASHHGALIEREWQNGCAQCTYYRLTPLGLAVRAYLKDQPQ